jgi:hypothetical protein
MMLNLRASKIQAGVQSVVRLSILMLQKLGGVFGDVGSWVGGWDWGEIWVVRSFFFNWE